MIIISPKFLWISRPIAAAINAENQKMTACVIPGQHEPRYKDLRRPCRQEEMQRIENDAADQIAGADQGKKTGKLLPVRHGGAIAKRPVSIHNIAINRGCRHGQRIGHQRRPAGQINQSIEKPVINTRIDPPDHAETHETLGMI